MGFFSYQIFKQSPQIVHGIATAVYGNMSFRYGSVEEVRANRKKFFDDLGISEEKVVVAQLEHSTTILDITEANWGKGIANPEESLVCDALVTDKNDVFLFFVVADCLALLIFDPVKQVCALAHAGWKGVNQELPRLVTEHLKSRYGSNPADLQVGFSPSLKAKSACFPELEQKSNEAHNPGWSRYITGEKGYWCVDTTTFALDQLLAAGVRRENIEVDPTDTRTSPDFFSHRRSVEENLPEQRFGALIGRLK